MPPTEIIKINKRDELIIGKYKIKAVLAYHSCYKIMNSVGKKQPQIQDNFFAELSFSTLFGELADKENFSWNFDSQPAG